MQIHNIIEQVDRRQSAMTALGELQLPNEGTLKYRSCCIINIYSRSLHTPWSFTTQAAAATVVTRPVNAVSIATAAKSFCLILPSYTFLGRQRASLDRLRREARLAFTGRDALRHIYTQLKLHCLIYKHVTRKSVYLVNILRHS